MAVNIEAILEEVRQMDAALARFRSALKREQAVALAEAQRAEAAAQRAQRAPTPELPEGVGT